MSGGRLPLVQRSSCAKAKSDDLPPPGSGISFGSSSGRERLRSGGSWRVPCGFGDPLRGGMRKSGWVMSIIGGGGGGGGGSTAIGSDGSDSSGTARRTVSPRSFWDDAGALGVDFGGDALDDEDDLLVGAFADEDFVDLAGFFWGEADGLAGFFWEVAVGFLLWASRESGAATRPSAVRRGRKPLRILTILVYTESVRLSK